MPTFINTTNPELRIFVPEASDYIAFRGGKLEIEEDEPGYEYVLEEATRNPSIQMLVASYQCVCGQTFTGKNAGDKLEAHKKAVHFELWKAEAEADHQRAILTEVIRRQPLACDRCVRLQEFQTAEELALHVKFVHEAVDVDDAGNVHGEGDGSEGTSAAAKPRAPRATATQTTKAKPRTTRRRKAAVKRAPATKGGTPTAPTVAPAAKLGTTDKSTEPPAAKPNSDG